MDGYNPTPTPSTISSRDFNQNSGRAKKAAKTGPVFITERGEPAYVFMTIEQYNALTGPEPSVADMLAQKDGEDFDFEPPRLEGPFWRPVDLD
jgi:prevent-host-death family protein